jgi:RNA polymerase sigma-70 factor, ECF subfamily
MASGAPLTDNTAVRRPADNTSPADSSGERSGMRTAVEASPVVSLASRRGPSVRAIASARDDVRSLVVAARLGDAGAFARLHALYGRMVHAIVLRRAPVEETADLVQDIFLKAWRTLASLDDPDAFGAWLGQIARNRTTDFFRTRHEHAELSPDLTRPNPPVDEAREILLKIRSLPDAYAETLLMRLVEGMTGPEIAERTGKTEGSVRVNLHRGMALLRERLEVKKP